MSVAEERPVYNERSKQFHYTSSNQYWHLAFYPGDDVFFMTAAEKVGEEWEHGNFSAPLDQLSVTVKSSSPREVLFSRRDVSGGMSITFDDDNLLYFERYVAGIRRLFAERPGIITTEVVPTGGG